MEIQTTGRSMKKASVVILNWNGIKFLKQFLPGVVSNTLTSNIEVVVADNGSTDESVLYVKANHHDVTLIEFDINYGFAEGYNRALDKLQSEYFILLNSDIEVTPNWINPMIEYMDANPNVGACMPKLLCFDDKDSFEYAGASGGYIDKYGYPFCRGRIFDTIEKDLGQYNTIENIFWATGACLFIRSHVYKEVGGLDPIFFAHMEEIDLCWRLHWYNYDIVVIPESIVYHVGGGALPKENPRKTFLNFRNNLFLLYKNLPQNILYKILLMRMCLDFIAALKFISEFKGKFALNIFLAHVGFYKNLKKLKKFRKSRKYLSNKMFKTNTILNKSIVKEYYLNNNKTFIRLRCYFV